MLILMNALLHHVTLMLNAPTQKVHSHVDVIMDGLVMDSSVVIIMNVKTVFNESTPSVLIMQNVSTMTVPSHANVKMVLKEMDSMNASTSTNAPAKTNVMPMPPVLIHSVATNALVTMVIMATV